MRGFKNMLEDTESSMGINRFNVDQPVDLADSHNTQVLLDGEVLKYVTYFDYGIDAEGYAAGVFKYIVGPEKRPKVGDRFLALALAWKDKGDVLRPIVRIPNVVISAEIGNLDMDAAGVQIECRWHNGGPDA
jgi:hypothetical protein